jgi:hypothetical protein
MLRLSWCHRGILGLPDRAGLTVSRFRADSDNLNMKFHRRTRIRKSRRPRREVVSAAASGPESSSDSLSQPSESTGTLSRTWMPESPESLSSSHDPALRPGMNLKGRRRPKGTEPQASTEWAQCHWLAAAWAAARAGFKFQVQWKLKE